MVFRRTLARNLRFVLEQYLMRFENEALLTPSRLPVWSRTEPLGLQLGMASLPWSIRLKASTVLLVHKLIIMLRDCTTLALWLMMGT